MQGVVHMPMLYKKYDGKISDKWRGKVQAETIARIALFQSTNFVGGKHLGKGPKAWQQGAPKRGWRGRGRGRGRYRAYESRAEQQDDDELDDIVLARDQVMEDEMDEFFDGIDRIDMLSWHYSGLGARYKC
jgi:hypothetical protein